jgi:hypothetical protein
MAWLDDTANTVAKALTAETIGRAFLLGVAIASIGTFVPLLLLNEIVSFKLPPVVNNGTWFVGLWFLLLIIVTITTLVSSLHGTAVQKREDEVAKKETNVKDREAAVVQRETAAFEREKDDLLTAFRRKIEGIWEMTYLYWDYDDDGSQTERSVVSHANFLVDESTGKLGITLDLKPVGHWKGDAETVTAIMIWPVHQPEHLGYYHVFSIPLDTGEQILGATFTSLDIRFDGHQPVSLSGTWYDLDQSFARINRKAATDAGTKVQKELPPRGRIQYKKLSGPISQSGASIEPAPSPGVPAAALSHS